MTTAVIVQARMGSTRLPGKVMADLAGKPVLEHVLRRCDRIPGIDVVVCAIPDTRDNDCLVPVIEACGARVVRGPELDVMARFLTVAKSVPADVLVRITADCPMLDPEICGEVIALLKREHAQYACNVIPRSYPKGLDCEAFTSEPLERLERITRESREHVTTAFSAGASLKTANLRCPYNYSDRRWVLDYPEDLEFMRAVFRIREPRRMQDVHDVLHKYPAVEKINANRAAL